MILDESFAWALLVIGVVLVLIGLFGGGGDR